ncbi:MAG: hypothetical protein EKK41_13760 [Hyphomicrobiales bacterium]|nr:MAG: hypothetical protein EKK41_13760 [Hyphomicrobiales bacterium]
MTMSIGSTIRKAALATTTAATLLAASSIGAAAQQRAEQAAGPPTTAAATAPSAAAQQPITKDECRAIAAVASKVVTVAGTNNLSVDFRQSFRNWLGPNITCDGPRDIVIRTGTDSDAFVTIREALGVGSRPIDIMARGGLRAIAPTAALGSGT